MPLPISRRSFLGCALLAPPMLEATPAYTLESRLGQLERRSGGRLGVAALNTATGERFELRSRERFALCSTFKFVAAALVLARVDRGDERLDRRVTFTERDLVAWSPVLEKHVGPAGVSIAAICHAAMTASDNTAGNLMLASFGGPPALTAFLRSIGDEHTRLDRWEPDLNKVRQGDKRDTTTPEAMLGAMESILLGNVLSDRTRTVLVDWLVANQTGDNRLRAGLPAGWRVGDKTGSNRAAANDIAIAWHGGEPPLLVAAYYEDPSSTARERDGVLAEVARIVSGPSG